MKYLALLLSLGFVAPAFADHKHATVHVKGMVCSFCAQGLTKKFSGQPGVSKVDVKLDKQTVTLSLQHDVSITDEKITEAIQDSGYNVVKIDRD